MATLTKTSSVTARVVAQPSAIVPGIPPFVFSVPKGWVVDQAPGALAVIRSPEEVGGFWLNAILSHDKVARSVGFQEAAAFTWARLQKQCPDVEKSFEKFAQFEGRPVFLRGSEMTSPQSKRRLAQLQAIFFAPVTGPGKVVDFFQIVCTAPTELSSSIGPDMLELIGSFKFV